MTVELFIAKFLSFMCALFIKHIPEKFEMVQKLHVLTMFVLPLFLKHFFRNSK